jgi:exonuclease SbcC
MITALSLKNWKSHGESHFEFGKGTNVLVGIMGSGKSAVINAICYGLYGTFPSMQRKEATIKDVVTFWGVGDTEVALSFTVGDESFLVKRKISKGKGDAELYKNNKLVEKGPKGVTEYIEGALKVDYDLFTRAIYSEQNRIDYFLSINPARRKQEIDELLGLDRFEKVREHATTLINKLGGERERLEKECPTEKMDEAKRKKEEHEGKVIELSVKLAEAEALLSKNRTLVEEKGKEVERLTALKREFDSLNEEKIKGTEVAGRLQKEVKGREVDEAAVETQRSLVLGIEKELAEKRQALRKTSDQISSLSSSHGSFKSRLETAKAQKEKIASLEKRVGEALSGETEEGLRKRVADIEKKLMEWRTNCSLIENSIGEIEGALSKLGGDIASCPLCGQELGIEKLEDLRKERGEEREKKAKELAEAKDRAEETFAEFTKTEKKLRDIEALTNNLKRMKEEEIDTAPLEKEIGSIHKEIGEKGALRETMEKGADGDEKKLRKEGEKLRELEEIRRKMDEAAQLGIKLKETEEKLSMLKFDEGVFEGERNMLEEAKRGYGESFLKLEHTRKEIGMIKELFEASEKELSRLVGIRKQAEYYGEQEEQLIIYKNCLIETQTRVREELVEAINSAMGDVWPIIYPYGDYTKVRLRVDPKDYWFEMYGGEWRAVDAVASGGERACLCLALRVAFAMVLTPNLSWLILDEPTHNLDEEAVRMLAETLQEKIPSIVDQTFVITHDTSLLESSFDTVYKLSRDKEGNESTVVEVIEGKSA